MATDGIFATQIEPHGVHHAGIQELHSPSQSTRKTQNFGRLLHLHQQALRYSRSHASSHNQRLGQTNAKEVYHEQCMNGGLAGGTAHTMPPDLQKAIISTPKVRALWEDITPLARNEWICWVTSGKKAETRGIRIQKAISKMKSGMRRPCCWVGCIHR